MNMTTQDEQQSAIATMATDIEPLPLDSQLKNALKQKVMQQIKAACPSGGITVRANEVDWLHITPQLSIKILSQDTEKKVQIAYWRLQPGGIIPPHSHHNDEECLVLEGDIRIGDHTLFAGDFNIMKKGSNHGPITTVGGALLYLKHDIPNNLL